MPDEKMREILEWLIKQSHVKNEVSEYILDEWDGMKTDDALAKLKAHIKENYAPKQKVLGRVRIHDTIYEVIERTKDEVCVLQSFDYADGLTKQERIWTDRFEEYKK